METKSKMYLFGKWMMIIFGVIFILAIGGMIVGCSFGSNITECLTLSSAIGLPLYVVPLALFFIGQVLRSIAKRKEKEEFHA